MGKRDYRRRETKKPKKGAQKVIPLVTIPPMTTGVEVVKKRRRLEEEPEREQ